MTVVHLSMTIRDLTATAVVTICAALPLAACGSASAVHTSPHAARRSTAALAPASGHVTVSISGYAFHPATITVPAGTKVTFTNHDQTAHTATGSGSGFDTGTVAPGRSATVTLRRPGTYRYVCQFHPFMQGTIVVRRP
jgi:plastocyanin